MFALTRPRLLVAVIVGAAGLASAALLALVAFSSTAEADHSWGDYHWARTSNPFTLTLGDNVDAKWDTYLQTAGKEGSGDWSADGTNTAQPNPLNTKIETPGGISPKRCNPKTGRVDVCNASYGRTGWLGVAGIYVSGSHITKAYSKLNDTYFDTATYNTPAWRGLVMCQEIGHTFGLDHTDETFNNANQGTCMDYTNDPDGGPGGASATDPSNEHPFQHDYDQLASIYQHLDSTTTIGQTSTQNRLPAAANQAPDDNDPSEWGQLIRQSPDGRLALYRKNLGGGHKLFRFVIWTEDAPQLNRATRR